MKRTLILILSLSTIVALGQTTQLKLASDVWPPFTDVEAKHAFALDLVKEALARTKVNANTEILNFKDVMAGIQNNKYAGSAALWRSPEREKYLLFSEPYLENRLILVGKKGSDVSANALSDLKNKRIAVVESYAYGALIDAKNCTLVKGTSDQQNLEHLLKGEADYMLVDALLVEYLLENQSKDAAKYLAIGTNTMLKLPLYFALRNDVPNAKIIIENFNVEIKKMITEGTYNKILQLNWIATDIDGEGHIEFVLSGDKAGIQAPVNSYMVQTKNNAMPNISYSYYIEGNHYKDWDQVPEKYKVPQSKVSDTDNRGFGPVFSF